MSLFEHEFKTLIPRTRLIESFERLANPQLDTKWFEGILQTYNQTRADKEPPGNFEHPLDVGKCNWQWHFEVRSDNGRKAEKELLPKRLKGIQEMGALVFLREMSDEDFKLLIPWVSIYAGPVFFQNDEPVLEAVIPIDFAIEEQGFYGDMNEDFYCSMAFFSTNRFYKTRRQNGWKLHKQTCQKIFELLQPKYAWLGLNPWQGGGTEVNRRLFPGTNFAYPWAAQFDMQIYGPELVERHKLRRFWWENEEEVFSFKWLDGNILWLEGPNGIVDESFMYRDYPNKFEENLKRHRNFVKSLLLKQLNETYEEKPVTKSMILDL